MNDSRYDKMFLLVMCTMTTAVYADEQDCPQSIPTLNIVDKCPKDITEWIKEKEKKQCHEIRQNCTNVEKFQYHCLPSSDPHLLLEVCTRTRKIIGKHCPFYDVQQQTIRPNYNQSCGEHGKGCPEVYSSKDVYKYQGCFDEVMMPAMASKQAIEIYMKGAETQPALVVGIYLVFASLVAALGFLVFREHIFHLGCFKGGRPAENAEGDPAEGQHLTKVF